MFWLHFNQWRRLGDTESERQKGQVHTLRCYLSGFVVHLDAKHEVCDLGKEHVRGNVAEASAASVGVRLVGWLVDLG